MKFGNPIARALVALALAAPATGLIATTPVAMAQDAPAQHQRVVPLEGGQNFRDLGGYETQDGRTVKWGMLYRSGAMDKLTSSDFAELRRRGIVVVSDFRDNRERTKAPVAWPEEGAPRVHSKDYAMDMGPIVGMLTGPDVTGEKAREAFAETYAELPYQFADQYKLMFAELLAGNAPLAFNCSAGKDRTGVAAALLLTALGVPRETVFEDYLLSNQYFKPADLSGQDGPEAAFYRSLPEEVIQALMGVERDYLEASFAGIEARSGSVEGYFEQELGLTPTDIQKLRDLYTE
ncbi:tyrosine-protein phosphatase [Stakelama tenebrarum]|uniref:Tyrosine-protein phosphatase n=1 Tax=Stakelama tenebrarum TaxID=2711215 RepID=A0A6G6Y6A6_9SPHN|nr:tyrosine-protein phosphatase [Sphingosinithalassobacter tenebrarum]QIG80455.1 tyrosine-protein phosphatase [Sphingosinithalassobacter tenebrarum]